MPATFVLVTNDSALADAWCAQLPRGRAILPLSAITFPNRLPPGIPVVLIIDFLLYESLSGEAEKCPIILVGDSESVQYQSILHTEKYTYSLNYGESKTKLFDIASIIEELAERNAALEILMERSRRSELPRPPPLARHYHAPDNQELWDLMEGALENIASKERLLSEFRRASRHILRASHTVFFLKEDDGYRADRGASFVSLQEPIISYLAAHPVVLDGIDWPGPADPIIELAVRNRLAIWGARLLIPLHENGGLVGLIVCGVRTDGQPYDESDKIKAVFIARLLKQFLACSLHLGRLQLESERLRLSEKYLPKTLILSGDEEPPVGTPFIVRALIGTVRKSKETQCVSPGADQPFRAKAGFVRETGGLWVFWEEASSEVFDKEKKTREERLSLLKEISLTLNHEIGNSLVSLMALKEATSTLPLFLQNAIRQDITRLSVLNDQLAHLSTIVETSLEKIDLRTMIVAIGANCGIKAEVGPDPVILNIAPRLLEMAVEAIVRAVIDNRVGRVSNEDREIVLQLRATGGDEALTALISLKGSILELEGILPPISEDGVPNQGRMAVFVAKEILNLHHGSIHAGPGLEGTEILISLRKW